MLASEIATSMPSWMARDGRDDMPGAYARLQCYAGIDSVFPLFEQQESVMTRKTANDFHPEVLKLFDQYVHGALPRRGFLKSAGQYAAVAGLTAEGLLSALTP